MNELLPDPSGTLLVGIITAIGALGMAAFALVDATKAVYGGTSNFGFGEIERGLQRFAHALDRALGPDEWRSVVYAHWINGRPRGEQKAIVKALIRLGLVPETAAELAPSAQLDADALERVASKLRDGTPLEERDLNVLGRLDAAVEAHLDAAFDRADQRYRNWSQVVAGFVAVGLAYLAARARDPATACSLAPLVIGLLAVPLAPIAKDLASSLTAATRAVGAVKALR
jgi:hypothetical protein